MIKYVKNGVPGGPPIPDIPNLYILYPQSDSPRLFFPRKKSRADLHSRTPWDPGPPWPVGGVKNGQKWPFLDPPPEKGQKRCLAEREDPPKKWHFPGGTLVLAKNGHFLTLFGPFLGSFLTPFWGHFWPLFGVIFWPFFDLIFTKFWFKFDYW